MADAEHRLPLADLGGPLGEVRTDELVDQGRPTWDLAVAAVRSGRRDDAVALARYVVTEAREAYELYREWIEALPGVIVDLGGDRARVAAGADRIAIATGVAGPADADRLWARFTGAVEAAVQQIASADAGRAVDALAAARAVWLEGHDRMHDHICAQIDLAAAELGEAQIGRLWDELLGDLYSGRGRLLEAGGDSPQTIRTLVLDVAAALRGHLSGPGREGSVEIVEESDRWRVSIPFCGSGGRTYSSRRAAEGDGAARPAAGMTMEAHPWAWETAGVCLYCAHCCQLQQRVPIAELGRPLRVVEPPRWPSESDRPRCNWYVYKDESAIPDSAYEAVGASPPERR